MKAPLPLDRKRLAQSGAGARRDRKSWPIILSGTVIFLAFALGGSARDDVYTLIALRPLAVILLGLGLWTCGLKPLRSHMILFVMTMLIWSIVAISLIPLPPALWTSLPGRQLIVQIDEAIGSGSLWRPLTITPGETWNALFSLVLPTALLVLLCGVRENHRAKLHFLFIGAAALTIVFGLAQAIGLFGNFYRISNVNAGIFANRNHHALVLACLIPMFIYAVLRANYDRRQGSSGTAKVLYGENSAWLMFWVATLLIVPLVFLAGSRAGLVMVTISAMASMALLRFAPQRVETKFAVSRLIGLSVAMVTLMGMLAVLVGSSRDVALTRLFTKNISSDLRFPVWQVTADLIGKYFPFGSGSGSFVKVYQIAEPYQLLQDDYINHAHNDLLEVLLTNGLGAAIVLVIVAVAYAAAVINLAKSRPVRSVHNLERALGLVIVGLCSLASLVDYPLRTPAVACLFVYGAFLISAGGRPKHDPEIAFR